MKFFWIFKIIKVEKCVISWAQGLGRQHLPRAWLFSTTKKKIYKLFYFTFFEENNITRTLLVALPLACLEISFVVKGAGAVILLFRLEYKTSVICHNVNTQKVKIARRDRPHILASNRYMVSRTIFTPQRKKLFSRQLRLSMSLLLRRTSKSLTS